MNNAYSSSNLDPRRIAARQAWPRGQKQANGSWIRNWHVAFKKDSRCLDEEFLHKELSDVGRGIIHQRLLDFSVTISFPSALEAIISITTRKPSDDDRYNYLTSLIMARVADLCGELQLIQGLDKRFFTFVGPRLFLKKPQKRRQDAAMDLLARSRRFMPKKFHPSVENPMCVLEVFDDLPCAETSSALEMLGDLAIRMEIAEMRLPDEFWRDLREAASLLGSQYWEESIAQRLNDRRAFIAGRSKEISADTDLPEVLNQQPYIAMRNKGRTPRHVYIRALQDGLGKLTAIRLIRGIFRFSYSDAMRVVEEVEGSKVQEHF